MNKASTQLLADTSAENRTLVQRTIDDLHHRLQALESQARERELELAEKNKSWKLYQVILENHYVWIM